MLVHNAVVGYEDKMIYVVGKDATICPLLFTWVSGNCQGCVEGSTDTDCNTNVHYVEIFCTHMKCEVKPNGIWEWGL